MACYKMAPMGQKVRSLTNNGATFYYYTAILSKQLRFNTSTTYCYAMLCQKFQIPQQNNTPPY